MENHSAIHHELAFAQGKMLNHGSWLRILPRGIMPSDLDGVIFDGFNFFDDGGHILFMEFSSRTSEWDGLESRGQRMGYEAIIRACNGKAKAVVAMHLTPREEQIDTKENVIEFQPMVFLDGKVRYGKVFDATYWVEFVKNFRTLTARQCLEGW